MNKSPKILFYDIECTNLSASMGYVLAIGYQFLGEKNPTVLTIADYPGKKPTDDKQLLNAFEKIHNSADQVVFHFGEYYDQPFLNTRRLIHGMKRLYDIPFADTWRIAKKRLKFHSNRLDAIAKSLGCPYKKTALDGNMWIDASAGDKKALKYIAHHCKMDVLVLAWVYDKVKVMWGQLPGVYGVEKCNSCGHKEFKSEGLRYTVKRAYRRLICKKCGWTTQGSIVK